MLYKENLILALESLRSNKMRSFLTMLGIIIGIASVIGIITVGNALSSSISSDLSTMGTHNFRVLVREKDNGTAAVNQPSPRSAMESGSASAGSEDRDRITESMITAYEASFQDQIQAIGLSESGEAGQVRDGRLYANVAVSGVNPGYMPVNNVELIRGRFINENDLAGQKNVAVISDQSAENIFGPGADALGKEIRFYDAEGIEAYIVVGVYAHSESSLFAAASGASEQDVQTTMYVPVSRIKADAAMKNYASITVMSDPDVDAQEFQRNTENFFARYYAKNPEYEISVVSMSSTIATATSMLSTISIAISVIAAISLLVGGIGVMNIMLVSVTERTREIGTRKALGAKNFHIRMQFITEAMILSLVGGIIGLMLGLVFGVVGSSLIGVPAAFSLPTILFTIAFSMVIGVFFGLYPANKAAQLNPIDALRYE